MNYDRFDTIDKCDKQITKLQAQLERLKMHKKQICTHDIIKFEGFCDDDYAYNKTYTHYLTCEQCGLQGRSGGENTIYKLLAALYDATDWQNREYVYDQERQKSWNVAYRKGKPNGKST